MAETATALAIFTRNGNGAEDEPSRADEVGKPLEIGGKDAVGKEGVKALGRKASDNALVLAIAMGMSLPEAAKASGCGVTTVYRRVKDEAFRAEVRQRRNELLERAIAKLVEASCPAIDTLKANLSNKRPAVRNKAASAILAFMLNGVQLNEIVRRLEALEESRHLR